MAEENPGEALPVCWVRVCKERSAFKEGYLVGYVPFGYCWMSTVIVLICPWDLWLNLSQHPILFWLDRVFACAITVSTVPQAPEAGEEPGCPRVFPGPRICEGHIAGIGPLRAEGPWMAFSSGFDFWNFQL